MVLVLSCASGESWELTEDEFLDRVDGWMAEGFVRAPEGRMSVQELDVLDRVVWHAYYSDARALVSLAREIREGRAAMRSRTRRKDHD